MGLQISMRKLLWYLLFVVVEIRKYFARIPIGFEIIFVVIFRCPTAFEMDGVEQREENIKINDLVAVALWSVRSDLDWGRHIRDDYEKPYLDINYQVEV